MRQFLFVVSLALLGSGVYLKLFYDVPDSAEVINFFVSWFLVIVGVASLLINLLWSSPRKTR